MRSEQRDGMMPHMKRALATSVGVILLLAGCGDGGADEPDMTAEAERVCLEGVRDRLKDPNSAEFQNVTVEYAGEATAIDFSNPDGSVDEDVPGEYWKVNGEVNAKNGFGGMVGFRDFECEANKYQGRDMDTGYLQIDKR